MKALDTYALVEIYKGNTKFEKYLSEDIALNDLTLIEFFWVLLRDVSREEAAGWYKKFEPYSYLVGRKILVKAMIFRKENKKKNLSFFDCVGYVFALENKIKFVTGNKEFEKIPYVEFVKNL